MEWQAVNERSAKIGRKSVYTQELSEEICSRLAEGESLRSICRDEHMPAKSNVLNWVVTDGHPFRDQYLRAREAAGFSHADEAADLRNGVLTGLVDPKAAQVALNALQWSAERMAPKKHSARQQIDHSSDDGSMTPAPAIDVSKISSAALEELLNAQNAESDG